MMVMVDDTNANVLFWSITPSSSLDFRKKWTMMMATHVHNNNNMQWQIYTCTNQNGITHDPLA